MNLQTFMLPSYSVQLADWFCKRRMSFMHRYKSNHTHGATDDGIASRLFHSQQDAWLDHFDWPVSGTVIVALSKIGEATINALRMNRELVVNIRSPLG